MFFLVVALKLIVFLHTSDSCADFCKCSSVKSRASENVEIGQRVVCTPGNEVTDFNDLLLNSLPNNTIYLTFHEASLSSIKSYSFVELPGLTKLDLSKNNISEIQDGAFANLSSLEKLDLSQNKIANLLPGVFQPLTSLQRLLLEGNFISRLPEGLFEHQSALKILDLANNPLICDCQLKWLIEWSRINRVRMPPGSICQLPRKLQGTSLSRLTRKDLHCKWPLQLPMFELVPHTNQLVFEGDSLSFSCRVSKVEPDTQIVWMLNKDKLSPDTANFTISTHLSPDGSMLVSSLYIKSLERQHSGWWTCQVITSKGNESRKIQVVVISAKGEICPRTVTVNNKGQYLWPETLAGITVEMDCAGTPSAGLGYQDAHAYYTCNSYGTWENLNTSACPYVSEVTKVLEQFAKTNFSLSQTNILDSARGLRNYTNDGSLLKDKMDVVYISRTLENYMQFVSRHREITEIIVDIVNTVMSVDRNVLKAAQVEDGACSRFVHILEQLPDILTDATLNRFRDNIAVEEFFVKSENFPGMTCYSYIQNNNNYKHNVPKNWNIGRSFQGDKILNCNMANSTMMPSDLSDTLEASLQLPSTIFQQAGLVSSSRTHNHKLQFIIYRNSILFPSSSFDRSHVYDITSSVISGKIAHAGLRNLSDPVTVALRTAAYTSDVRPVWWDPQASGGKGDWSSDGCSILKVHKNIVTFSCSQLANFGLLQDVEALLLQYGLQMAQFRPSHPAIYVGALLCSALLILSIAVYCYGFRKIQMPKKTKHSFINTWLSITLLCIVFSLGIHQTDVAIMCQSIGLVLHYLTLCTLLWMLVTASNLYKKMTRSEPSELPSDEPLPDHPLPPKPMLRFYLVGWGIASIVCGISAAVHLENYGGNEYCFLSLNPSLGALYGPSAVLLVFIAVLYLLILCALQNTPSVKHPELSDENVVMELTQISPSVPKDSQSESGTSEDEEDAEHSYQMQLRYHAVLLFIFLLAWLSAAASIGRPFAGYLLEDELIFALLFCFISASLGTFVFLCFCYYREDAHSCIIALCHCRKIEITEETKDKLETVPMVKSEAAAPLVNSQESPSQDNRAAALISGGNPTSTDPNLLNSCSSDHSVAAAEMFYDPRQNIVARKFFEKNRRQQQLQQLQKNNLEKAAIRDQNKRTSVKSDGSNSSQNKSRTGKSSDDRTNNGLVRPKSPSSATEAKLPPVGTETDWAPSSLSQKPPHLPRSKLRNCERDLCSVLTENSQVPSSNALQSCSSDVNVNSFGKPKKSRTRLRKRQHSWDSRHRVSSRSKNCVHLEPQEEDGKRCPCHFQRSRSTYDHLTKKSLAGMISSPSDLSSASSKCLHTEIY